MEFGKKILCLLAIFCILGSCIAAVSTENVTTFDGGYTGSQYNVDEQGGYAGINYYEN